MACIFLLHSTLNFSTNYYLCLLFHFPSPCNAWQTFNTTHSPETITAGRHIKWLSCHTSGTLRSNEITSHWVTCKDLNGYESSWELSTTKPVCQDE